MTRRLLAMLTVAALYMELNRSSDYSPLVTKICGELWMDLKDSSKVDVASGYANWIPIYSVRVRVREGPKR